MPFLPHTKQDEKTMLEAIGVNSIEDLFDEIPPDLRAGVLNRTPEAITEMELVRLMSDRARQDEVNLSFLGAGAYHHHIPAAVWDLVGRGEFMTAYTPYQAEASQGTLQLIYEFQTMMTRLTGMDVANASVYDGASALAEAVLMAVRANRKSKSKAVLLAGNIHPNYLSAVKNIVKNQGITIQLLPFDKVSGSIDTQAFKGLAGEDFAATAISYPNFFGGLEAVHEITNFAHENGQLLIGVVNPMALGLLGAPGQWGDQGADIVVGEGQPFGIPVASGGPYLGYMCCKQAIVRQMPGRIIGMTEDTEGKVGFALTLQAREQHIRRGKATSNICTNQGLLVTAATIYLSLMGDAGVSNVAAKCHQGLNQLVKAATSIHGVSSRFSQAVFHETVLQLPKPASEALSAMAKQGVLGGYDLGLVDESLSDCMLTNVTEVKTEQDIAEFTRVLTAALEA
jgi:glycine dehydrogenase subunit 1